MNWFSRLFRRRPAYHRPGHEKLWGWFGLSYASWLTIPRVLMHEMPDKWQGEMATLLIEYEDAFPNRPDLQSVVCVKHNNRYVKPPEWLLNYRHPDRNEIIKLRPSVPTSP
ncbi:MAG TPA: hypothetical protein VMQ76_09010 [Terracidiphilus sp.]|nr:hypothetical protein [Terracidiphilus sp.]